ncbi:hypothetical protein CICLE_v10019978mg [Citrus x clementina]|uniref:DUF4005 domain-containing protein n=1 Tax=Citrus clementina TaxID=85681 RepID=V4TRD3_CITCL|nr:hypothetical protein CICLE_v10019978mg [Citrus x clementina]
MGKKSGISWFTIVKRAFRSPSKNDNEKRNSRRREDEFELEEEEKKREKRRSLFRKADCTDDVLLQRCEAKMAAISSANTRTTKPMNPILASEQGRAYALAAATAAAAMEIVRHSRPASSNYVREHYAATVIQTSFRGYLARRALRALKGLVKLQALVRGQNVRHQAKLTLKRVQALVRAQDMVRDQRTRFSHEGSRRSLFAETNDFWDSKNLHDIKSRKSMSSNNNASGTITIADWNDHPCTSQGIKEAVMKREKTLAYAFSNQVWRSRRNPSAGDERELDERTKWLDRWMATKQWENSATRASTDRRDHIMKTVETDASRPKYQNQKQPRPPPIQVRLASPRSFLKEQTSFSAAQTPTLNGVAAATSTMPNYMAATESAKAKARSQSAPRQRASTSMLPRERSGSVKKRLSYPAPEPHCCQNSRSSSFKSVPAGCGGYSSGMEQLSNYSSCYAESYGGEISPCPSGSRFSLNLWE